MKRELTDAEFVNWVRVKLGLNPIPRTSGARPTGELFDLGYLRLERFRRLADPDCKTCGGSGYYDSWSLDLQCACTRRQLSAP